MNYRRVLLLQTILAFSSPAFAQQPQNRAGHPGGGAGHPGQSHPGQGQQHHTMTPEMLHEHMMQQFWYDQVLLNEMFTMRTPRRGHTQPHQGAGQPQPSTNQPQPGESRHEASKQTDSRQQAKSHSTGSEQEQSNPTRGTKAHQAEETSRERQHHRDQPIRKTHPREASPANKHPLAADQGTIGLLRTVHTRLQKADADYGGHRVRAMEHIGAALSHLGATSPVIPSLAIGAGNLPQSQSDQLLRDAIHTLSRTELSVGAGAHAAPYHHSARVAVAEAIRELHIALRIR
ncbi:MAG: hypothetical protein ACHRXM_05430 [Isosphaerales bacterium]